MTQPNPFEALGGQFVPAQPVAPQAPAAPVAPAYTPDPVAQPVAPVAPAYAPAPTAAPVAPAAPVAAPIYAPSNAPSPATAGAAAFGTSRGGGDGFKLKDALGQPVLFRIQQIRVTTDQQGNPKEVADVDVVVLSTTAPALHLNSIVWNGPIVRDLKETVQNGRAFHVGRIKEVPSKHPQPALALGPLTDEEMALATLAGQTFGWW